MLHVFFICLISYITTLITILSIRPVAIRIGLVDSPSERKQHEGKVPLVGGIGMAFGLAIGFLLLNISLEPYRALFLSIILLVFIGILDDFHGLSPRARFFVQILSAFIIIFTGKICVNNLGDLLFLGPLNLGDWGIPFTVIAIIGILNAINMIDGHDGLAGSVVVTELLFLILIALFSHRMSDLFILLVMMSALLGFLTLNWPFFKHKSYVFMGDVGSMLLGIILCWFLISLSQVPTALVNPVTFLWIMALPLFDMVNVVYRRLRRGASPVQADREHLHHIFYDRGWGKRRVAFVLPMFSLFFGGVGLLLDLLKCSESIMFLLFLACFLGYCISFNKLYPIRQKGVTA